jgi:hypothetical protein
MGSQDLADSAIETFDHAVGLGATGRNQAMFDLCLRTELVDRMAAGRFAFALSKALPRNSHELRCLTNF